VVNSDRFYSARPKTWCPGCGNHLILEVLKETLTRLEYQPREVLLVSGIGQAAKTSQYIRTNTFNVLHGRTLPVATGVKLVNPDLRVIAVGGDGDGYAEGGNHIIHAARRNVEVTYLIHNNQIYGLTKGQLSPTTDLGSPTSSYHNPNGTRPLNPLRFLLGVGASFVARGFAGHQEQLGRILKQALQHRGFACIDILQPCVVFNKVNTFKWYRERVYDINKAGHDPEDLAGAFRLAGEWGDRIGTGIFYAETRETLNDALLGREARPLVQRVPRVQDVAPLLQEYL